MADSLEAPDAPGMSLDIKAAEMQVDRVKSTKCAAIQMIVFLYLPRVELLYTKRPLNLTVMGSNIKFIWVLPADHGFIMNRGRPDFECSFKFPHAIILTI